MAKIRGQGKLNWQRTGGGALSIDVDRSYLPIFREALQRLKQFEDRRREKDPSYDGAELDFLIEVHYKKRTLNMNRLMWALLEIRAHEYNAQRTRSFAVLRDAEYFYQLYLQLYAPRETDPDTGVEVIRTSSKFSTLEMGEFIDHILDDLAELSVTDPADIETYWRESRQKLNDDGALPEDKIMTIKEYRANVKRCEACGKLLYDEYGEPTESGGGSVAHISAIGMGGPRPGHVHSRGVMLLCDADHAAYDNGKGDADFIEQYPWLQYKIESAKVLKGEL